MKTPSDELYNLIKSLSSEEKRQFKLFSIRSLGETNYLKLFDAIDSLKQYDTKKLTIILDKKGGVNNLNYLKNYLQEAILKFLEYHCFDYSIEIQLQRQLHRVELLFGKRQFSLAKKCLVKAEEIAVENHHYLFQLNILAWKRKMMVKKLDLIALNEYEQTFYPIETHTIDLYKNMAEYQKIGIRLRWFLITQGENPDEIAIAELKEILKSPFLLDEEKALSIPTKVMYCRILRDIHFLLGNWEEGYTYLQRLVSYFEQARFTPGERLMVYSRLITVLSKLKRSGELVLIKNNATKLITSLPKKVQTRNLYGSYLAFINNYINHQLSVFNITEALSASDELLELVKTHASVQRFLVYYGNRALIYFLIPDYRHALQCVNKVFSVGQPGIRQDIVFQIRFFSLILHYELGNEDILPGLCKSAAGLLNKKRPANQAEELLLDFFGNIVIQARSKNEKIKVFSELKKALIKYKTKEIVEFFDFISWAESKIQNRPMLDILREKVLSA